MTIRPADRATVESYYHAMRLGAAGAAALARLFTDDVYLEPFSAGDGQIRTHIGNHVIAEFFKDSVNHRSPDMVVTVNRIDAEGDRLRAEWTCTLQFLPSRCAGWASTRCVMERSRASRPCWSRLVPGSLGSFRLQALKARGMIGMR
jgi:SnoaL-like domain